MNKNLFGVFLAVAFASMLGACAVPSSDGSRGELPTASDQTDSQQRARIRLQLAVGYYEQRQLAIALDEIKQALQADPNYADAHSMRALIYMEMGETRLAEDSFQRAIRLAPNNPDLSNNYGWFLCQNGQEAQSIAHFEAALKSRAYQSPGKALSNAGVCSMKMKDLAAAERYLTQAFQVEPGNPATNVNLAKLYYGRQDYQRARFHIQRVVKADLLTSEVLWVAIKVERKLNDRQGELSLATQLRRRHPGSPEYAAYLRGAFDE